MATSPGIIKSFSMWMLVYTAAAARARGRHRSSWYTANAPQNNSRNGLGPTTPATQAAILRKLTSRYLLTEDISFPHRKTETTFHTVVCTTLITFIIHRNSAIADGSLPIPLRVLWLVHSNIVQNIINICARNFTQYEVIDSTPYNSFGKEEDQLDTIFPP